MRKRSRIVIAGLVTVCLGIFAWQILRPREPWYEGKPLSEWLKAYVQPGSPYAGRQKSIEADLAMDSLGTNAIPTLLRMLSEHDRPVKHWLLDQLKQQRFIAISGSLAPERNYAAAYAFQILGPRASNAVPDLIAIHERHISFASEQAVVMALAYIGPPAKDAVPWLIADLTHGDTALFALVRIHARPELCIPIFNRSLSSISAYSRQEAATGLGSFGKQASNSVPILLPLLTDTNIFVRKATTNALQAIVPEVPIANP